MYENYPIVPLAPERNIYGCVNEPYGNAELCEDGSLHIWVNSFDDAAFWLKISLSKEELAKLLNK